MGKREDFVKEEATNFSWNLKFLFYNDVDLLICLYIWIYRHVERDNIFSIILFYIVFINNK